MGKLARLFDDFFTLFYPRLCLACHKNLSPKQHLICIHCQYLLPRTNFHLEKENRFTEKFWGRIKLEAGAALYYFSKGGRTQELIHQLKYNGKSKLAYKLGQLYGIDLAQSPLFSTVDLIIPVPLHPKKKRIRGFNQSELIVRGLADTMKKAWAKDILIRVEMTATQTQKTRMDRFENVRQAFQLKNTEKIKGKHVLLVDDVLTTGATLEACALVLLEASNVRISMVTIAYAN